MTASHLGVILICLLLAGCGNKGDLFLVPDSSVADELDQLDRELRPEPGDGTLPEVLPDPGDEALLEVLPEPGDGTLPEVLPDPGNGALPEVLPDPGDEALPEVLQPAGDDVLLEVPDDAVVPAEDPLKDAADALERKKARAAAAGGQ